MHSLFLVAALLVSYVHAGAKFNAPTGSTTWDASAPRIVKWRESGTDANRTTLAMMGDVKVTLWAGSSSNGKTMVAELGQTAATNRELQVDIPTTAGGNGQVYFIHLQSVTLPDRIYESHKFGLSNMTGQFGQNVTQSIHSGSTSSNSTQLTGSSAPSYNTTRSNANTSKDTTGGASTVVASTGALAFLLALAGTALSL